MSVSVNPQSTPNPNAMKFTVSRTVIEEGSKSYDSKDAAAENPVAAELMSIAGVVSVFMLKDFITLSKSPEADWETIAPAAVEIIQAKLA